MELKTKFLFHISSIETRRDEILIENTIGYLELRRSEILSLHRKTSSWHRNTPSWKAQGAAFAEQRKIFFIFVLQ